jgi:hypothetical protein
MRTKALLTLAALVVSAGACVAQSSNVYSLNIVGYVNVPYTNGLTLIANPLKPSNGNYNITNTVTLPNSAADAQLFTWGGTSWAGTVPTWIPDFGWDADVVVPLGNAFFLRSPAPGTITFVGEVQTGNVQYNMNQGINIVANKVPVDERWPGSTSGGADDLIYTWNIQNQSWGNAYTFIPDFGWDHPTDTNVNGPLLRAGEGVAYVAQAPRTWTRTFNP